MATEAGIQKAVLEYLAMRRDVTCWRNNVGAFGGQSRQGKRWWVRFGRVGQADISGLVRPFGVRLEIEVKAPAGGCTENQMAFGDEIKEYGGIWLVVRSVQETEDKLGEAIKEWRAKWGP